MTNGVVSIDDTVCKMVDVNVICAVVTVKIEVDEVVTVKIDVCVTVEVDVIVGKMCN